jgi:hypothetical protein
LSIFALLNARASAFVRKRWRLSYDVICRSGITGSHAASFYDGPQTMKRQIEFEIGFADGEISSYCADGGDLKVQVEAWNGKQIDVEFKAFEGLADYGAGNISDLVEANHNDFYRSVVANVYVTQPTEWDLKLFQFLDADSQPVLEIVAPGVEIVTKNRVTPV